jgi:1,4-alpha-glucan branching enzyme
MAKKTIKKSTRPLVSALTVARRENPPPVLPPAPSMQFPSVQISPVQTILSKTTTVKKSAGNPPTSTTERTSLVTFMLYEPHARSVALSGEFNAWSTVANHMRQLDNGVWQITLALAPGKYQYKFVVDGQWRSDVSAKETVDNQFGTLNSVIEVHP